MTSSSDYLKAPPPRDPDAWTAETAGRGSQRLLAVGVVPATAEVAEALGLEDGAPAVRRERLVMRDGEPVEIVVSHWPASWAAGTGLAEARKIRGGAVALLAELGKVAARAVETVSAEVVDGGSQAWPPPGVAVLMVRRTSCTAAGEAIEYTVMASWDGRRQAYKVEVA